MKLTTWTMELFAKAVTIRIGEKPILTPWSKINNQKSKMLLMKKNIGKPLVGPTFSGRSYLMLKTLSRIPDGDFYIITKSLSDQKFDSKIKIKEIGEEMKPLNEYKRQ